MSAALPYCLPVKPIIDRYTNVDYALYYASQEFLENPSCGGYVDGFGIDWGDPYHDPSIHQAQGGVIAMIRIFKWETIKYTYHGYNNLEEIERFDTACGVPQTFWKPLNPIGYNGVAASQVHQTGETHWCETHQRNENVYERHYIYYTVYIFIPAFPSLIPLLAPLLPLLMLSILCFGEMAAAGSNAATGNRTRRRKRQGELYEY